MVNLSVGWRKSINDTQKNPFRTVILRPKYTFPPFHYLSCLMSSSLARYYGIEYCEHIHVNSLHICSLTKRGLRRVSRTFSFLFRPWFTWYASYKTIESHFYYAVVFVISLADYNKNWGLLGFKMQPLFKSTFFIAVLVIRFSYPFLLQIWTDIR